MGNVTEDPRHRRPGLKSPPALIGLPPCSSNITRVRIPASLLYHRYFFFQIWQRHIVTIKKSSRSLTQNKEFHIRTDQCNRRKHAENEQNGAGIQLLLKLLGSTNTKDKTNCKCKCIKHNNTYADCC